MRKNKKLRIAQIVSLEESVPPKARNGLEFVVSWLTEELVKRGHEVTLFAPANSKTTAKLISLFPHGTNGKIKKVWGWSKGGFSDWNTSLAVNQQNEFDILHFHTDSFLKFMPFIKKTVFYTIHEPCHNALKKEYLKKKKYLPFFNFPLQQYKKVHYINISQRQAKDFLRYQKYYFKKHTTIHNGIPVASFEFNNQPQDYLLYLGYINPQKGADVAVNIARQLKMKLILAGDNFGEEYFLKNKIKPYLNKQIQYIGPVGFKQKIKLLKNALALINPVRWNEPFGLVPIEAQACGTPVIALNNGAMPEIIKDKQTGFVVDSEKEIIRAVKKIDTINRQNCRDWVEKKFSVQRMVDDYEKLYKKLIK